VITLPNRIPLAQLPTPLERLDHLTAAWGGPRLWVKRDDLTGFGLSGNKVRKLEFHLAAALAAGADTVVTCGAAQSNHCRATALAAARLGLRSVLVIRTPDGAPAAPTGNHLLHRLVADRIATITPGAYVERDAVMTAVAADEAAAGHRCWIIPEGASDALGMWGFVLAMRELAEQLDGAGISRPPTVWHAASSGGTTAGLGWAADRLRLGTPIIGTSVGDTAAALWDRVHAVWSEAIEHYGGRRPDPDLTLLDRYVGGGYGVATRRQLELEVDVTRHTGLLFDPTYTGKALFALRAEIDAGRWGPGDDVVFWHTGGGFAVFAYDYGDLTA
jgi:D-cysteine desulfhydrase family pyridoxal phosphate-dependent enzyme